MINVNQPATIQRGEETGQKLKNCPYLPKVKGEARPWLVANEERRLAWQVGADGVIIKKYNCGHLTTAKFKEFCQAMIGTNKPTKKVPNPSPRQTQL